MYIYHLLLPISLFQNGDHKLTFHIYRLSFLNFLLGKQPNGPGQYLFGTVTPQTRTCMFPIDYSAMNSTEEDLEPYRPDKLLEKKGSRRSVLVWYLFKWFSISLYSPYTYLLTPPPSKYIQDHTRVYCALKSQKSATWKRKPHCLPQILNSTFFALFL